MMVVNNPLIRPYFLGGWHWAGPLIPMALHHRLVEKLATQPGIGASVTQEAVQQYCEHLGNIVNCKIFVKDDRPLGRKRQEKS